MGDVYLAEDMTLDRQVAFKTLPPMLADTRSGAPGSREAKAIATLNHANIVTVHSVEEAAASTSSRWSRSRGRRPPEMGTGVRAGHRTDRRLRSTPIGS
jgi:serine/threonine protein kinase